MTNNLSNQQKSLLKKFLNPFTFSLYFFLNVPMVWFSGMRLSEFSKEKCISELPFKWYYRWQNMNPFKSVYFAVQCMGAEISTASLVALAINGKSPSIAFIVTKMRSQYFKKAVGATKFTCNDGDKIFDAVDQVLKSDEGVEIEAKTTGTLEDGTIVSEFYFTWSLKQRKR